MMLYQEIIFLKHHFTGKYVVENVIPYYDPLIPGQKRGRHLYWSNFHIPNNIDRQEARGFMCGGGDGTNEYAQLLDFHKIDKDWVGTYKGEQSRTKILRNLVDYEVGNRIFEAMKDDGKNELF